VPVAPLAPVGPVTPVSAGKGTPPVLLVVAICLALAPVLVVATNVNVAPLEVVICIVLISDMSKALVVNTSNWYVVDPVGSGTKV
jgi:hypothetical protein